MTLRPPAEAEIVRVLHDQPLSFAPVTLSLVQNEKVLAQDKERHRMLDGVLQASWKGYKAFYGFDYKASASPQMLEIVLVQMQRSIRESEYKELLPLVILPFLNEAALRQLSEHEVSGLDLCGNGVLFAPNFQVWRTGHPNRFKGVKTLPNPFAGDSSIFARCFLLRPEFKTLSELQRFARGGLERSTPSTFERAGLALGTASKVVRALTEEMVISKQGNKLRLTNARRLMELLRQEAQGARRKRDGRDATTASVLVGKTSLSHPEMWARLNAARRAGMLRSVVTGVGSASHYGVLSGLDTPSLYVDDLPAARELLEVRETDAFANIRLYEERKNAVYFDARAGNEAQGETNSEVWWASPIQTWLELSQAGPREQEAARMLENLLLEGRAELLS